ncbi:porin family protein [Pedobacter frigidisoli]|uniref:porin family protein n=1 Tax=Pedobacter frigidisoli TaxID=2530455 RepID=UPI00292FEE77|nr:porin family protein [Pedobacter frigidisoli]
MKQTFFTLLFLPIFFIQAKAQRKPLKIGGKAGATFPNIHTSTDAIAYDGGGIKENDINTSFYFGATVDLPVGKNMLLQPGFTVSGKGTKVSYYSYLPNSPSSAKINLTYLELPANLVRVFPFKGGRFFVGLGPYVAYALSGTVKYTFSNTNIATQTKQAIEFGSTKNFKRFDLGGNALAGYTFGNGINIHSGISASAFKISNSTDTYLDARNLVFSAGLGYAL